MAVPHDAYMTYAGDNWRVLFDDSLRSDTVRCIEDWAKTWPKIGAIKAYPKSRFEIPKRARPK